MAEEEKKPGKMSEEEKQNLMDMIMKKFTPKRGDPEWFAEKIRYYFSTYQKRKAVKTAEEALAMHPQNEVILAWASLAYAFAEEFERCQELAQKAMRIKPDYSMTYIALSLYHATKREPDKALEMGKKALRLDPDNLLNIMILSDLLTRFGNADDAIELLDKALKENADNEDVLAGLGTAFMKKGDWEKAKECFESALKINPENPTVLGHMARYYFNKGDRKKTAEFSSEVLKFDPTEDGAEAINQASQSFIFFKILWVIVHLKNYFHKIMNAMAPKNFIAGEEMVGGMAILLLVWAGAFVLVGAGVLAAFTFNWLLALAVLEFILLALFLFGCFIPFIAFLTSQQDSQDDIKTSKTWLVTIIALFYTLVAFLALFEGAVYILKDLGSTEWVLWLSGSFVILSIILGIITALFTWGLGEEYLEKVAKEKGLIEKPKTNWILNYFIITLVMYALHMLSLPAALFLNELWSQAFPLKLLGLLLGAPMMAFNFYTSMLYRFFIYVTIGSFFYIIVQKIKGKED